MYAIVETGGKQYRVESGSLLQVESLPGDVGGRVELSEVRLVHGDKGIVVNPWSRAQRSRRKSSTRAGLDRSWSSRSNGARITGARRAIVRALQNSKQHHSSGNWAETLVAVRRHPLNYGDE